MGYVFGPVASRRLGRSLGVDLIPFKTCPYDCVYCQLGHTTRHTALREEWIPIDAIMQELGPKLAANPDYITLGGSGEPTLFSALGDLIQRIKAVTEVPVAVLTNGALLWREEVRAELLAADLVSPSLDAGDEPSFQRVNRPCAGISFEQMLDGLIQFRREYAGNYWLEVLLVADWTGEENAVRKIADCARRIQPDRVQLNTITRPPADESAQGLSRERLTQYAGLFNPPAEVIADFHDSRAPKREVVGESEVFDLIRRHPCSLEEVAAGLGAAAEALKEPMSALLGLHRIEKYAIGNKTHYRAVQASKG